MSPVWIKVTNEHQHQTEIYKYPVEENGGLRIDSIKTVFPNVASIAYKCEDDNTWICSIKDDNCFFPAFGDKWYPELTYRIIVAKTEAPVAPPIPPPTDTASSGPSPSISTPRQDAFVVDKVNIAMVLASNVLSMLITTITDLVRIYVPTVDSWGWWTGRAVFLLIFGVLLALVVNRLWSRRT